MLDQDTEISADVLQLFRTRRCVCIAADVLSILYGDPRYSDLVRNRETRGFPDLRDQYGYHPVPCQKRPLTPPRCPAPPPPPRKVQKTTDGRKLWTELFAPPTVAGVYGQKLSVGRIDEWVRENAWRKSVLLLNGPSGCGKSLTSRILFPDAVFFDFNSFSLDAFQAVFAGMSMGCGPIPSSRPKASAVVISDFSCLPEKSQKYIVDIVLYFAAKVLPLPVIFIFDDIPFGVSTSLSKCSRRVTMSRLSVKCLVALGINVCALAGISGERMMSSVKFCANAASNGRHFITILEKRITGRDANVGIGAAGDVSFSPFELVRRTWLGSESIDSIVASDINICHWLAANTIAAFPVSRKSAAVLCDDYSLFDTTARRLFPHSTHMTRYAAVLSTRVAIAEVGYGEATIQSLPVAYPDSLRREFPVETKACLDFKNNPAYAKNPQLFDAFNKF